SPNFSFFLGARLLQSFGGGGIFIIASSYVISTYTKKKQGSMLGMIGGMHGIASVIGPGLGSFIIDFTGTWHGLFFIKVAFVFVGGLGLLRLSDQVYDAFFLFSQVHGIGYFLLTYLLVLFYYLLDTFP